MSFTQTVPTDEQLRAWDWRAELERQDRPIIWLARRTGTHYQKAYRFANGDQEVPTGWLQAVWNVLGRPALP